MIAQAEQQYGYQDYMPFGSPEANPWAPERITECLDIMEAREPLVTPTQRDQILFCYWQLRSRFFHTPEHGGFVSQREIPEPLKELLAENGYFTEDEAGAVLAIAGLFHDIAYKHVDADDSHQNAWPTALRELIGGMAEYDATVAPGKKPVFRTRLTEAGQNDEVTKMVAGIFDVQPEGIIHNEGGNEFDSALAAAKFLEKRGVPAKFIVAVTSAIAATIPFRESLGTDKQGNITDGYMGELALRVKDARLPVDEQGYLRTPATPSEAREADADADDRNDPAPQRFYEPDWRAVNAMMLLSVQLSSRDLAPFLAPDNPIGVAEGARLIKMEEIRQLRLQEVAVSGLARAAWLLQSAPGLYLTIINTESELSGDRLPNVYFLRDDQGRSLGPEASYPPTEIHRQASEHSHNNADGASKFFMMHELGIIFAAAVGTLIKKPDAPVPGLVDSALCHEKHFELAEDELAPLPGVFRKIYDALGGQGVVAAGTLTPPEAPLSRFILGSAGEEQAMRLSRTIQRLRKEAPPTDQDPFSDTVRATEYLYALGRTLQEDKFNRLMDMLDRVAVFYQDDPERGDPNRLPALQKVRKQILNRLYRDKLQLFDPQR